MSSKEKGQGLIEGNSHQKTKRVAGWGESLVSSSVKRINIVFKVI